MLILAIRGFLWSHWKNVHCRRTCKIVNKLFYVTVINTRRENRDMKVPFNKCANFYIFEVLTFPVDGDICPLILSKSSLLSFSFLSALSPWLIMSSSALPLLSGSSKALNAVKVIKPPHRKYMIPGTFLLWNTFHPHDASIIKHKSTQQLYKYTQYAWNLLVICLIFVYYSVKYCELQKSHTTVCTATKWLCYLEFDKWKSNLYQTYDENHLWGYHCSDSGCRIGHSIT